MQQDLSQKLVKFLANLCFTTFVVFVLILTVIAITYQPPDPWLDSSVALTRTFSETLQNATFTTDDSILSTGEDIVPFPSPSPGESTTNPFVFPPVSAPAASCEDVGSVNCSDPRVILAIRQFNYRTFKRSVVFLGYNVSVRGSRDDECDVSWKFRNKKEKSWRKYRDYRRFRLVVNDDCSVSVVAAGKFHSGVNAAPKTRIRNRTKSGSSMGQALDAEINDTIPVVPVSEFERGRYLYYSRGGDHCKGMNQFLWSFLCGLGEARYLNRTFVVDLGVCLAGSYTPSGKDEDGKDFRLYFDFEHLKESASVVEKEEFLKDWGRLDGKKSKISVRNVPTYKVSPMQLKKERSTIIWRKFDGKEPENYWYRVCEGKAAKYIERPWETIWKSKHLMNIVSQIAGRMDWDFDAVHVVRGEKALNKELWPNLDSDTSPDALVDKLTKVIQPWRNLYIATNELFYNYFDKLRSHFKVHLLDDYKDLWSVNSEWYNETVSLNNGRPVAFDGYMRVAVDTEVFYRSKARVETFNNLTKDCKDGVNRC